MMPENLTETKIIRGIFLRAPGIPPQGTMRIVDYPLQICCAYLEEERSRHFNRQSLAASSWRVSRTFSTHWPWPAPKHAKVRS